MVSDATLSGINDYLRAPNFIFPPMGSLLMMVGPKNHMFNLDAG